MLTFTKKWPNCFPKCLYHFIFLPEVYEGWILPYLHLYLPWAIFLIRNSNKYKVISPYGLICDSLKYGTSFQAICHLYIFFGEVFLKNNVLIFYWVILLLTFECSLILCNSSYLLDIWFTSISLSCDCSFSYQYLLKSRSS